MQQEIRSFSKFAMLIVISLSFLCSDFVTAANVVYVSPTGTNTQITQALGKVSPGDVILVADGVYDGFTVGMPLTIIADTRNNGGSGVWISGSQNIKVEGIGNNQHLTLKGLKCTRNSGGKPALHIKNCQGNVWVENCFFDSNWHTYFVGTPAATVLVEGCADVQFHDCVAIGGEGWEVGDIDPDPVEGADGGVSVPSSWSYCDGTPGMEMIESFVGLWECCVFGGRGHKALLEAPNGPIYAGDGSPAVLSTQSNGNQMYLFLSGKATLANPPIISLNDDVLQGGVEGAGPGGVCGAGLEINVSVGGQQGLNYRLGYVIQAGDPNVYPTGIKGGTVTNIPGVNRELHSIHPGGYSSAVVQANTTPPSKAYFQFASQNNETINLYHGTPGNSAQLMTIPITWPMSGISNIIPVFPAVYTGTLQSISVDAPTFSADAVVIHLQATFNAGPGSGIYLSSPLTMVFVNI